MIQRKEEYVVVLDFLPHGKSSEATKEPVAQVIGENNFTLLEVITRPDVQLAPGQRVYVGREERKEIDHIKGRINYVDLTGSSQQTLHEVVHASVVRRESEFVGFLNKAGSVSIRSHMLELLPGIGKKHLDAIISERTQKQFESFADFHSRVQHVTSIDEVFTQRIVEELRGESKYYLFAKSPKREEEEWQR